MINILSARSYPSSRSCISQRSLEVFWYYQAFSRPLHRYPSLTLLQASQQTVKVVSPTLASTPLTLSTSIGDDPRATLTNCLDDFLTSCLTVFAISGIRGSLQHA